ncbi:MAG: PP2C family protein-serine/threonine phosphatase [bacterium]
MSKKFYRDIERFIDSIDVSHGPEEMLRAIMKWLLETPTDVYGIQSGRLYRERSKDYVLIESIGEFGAAITGKTVSKDYPIVRKLERKRLYQISPETPGFDPVLEAQFTHLENAAILVGANPAYILSLGICHCGNRDQLLVVLETLRATIGLKLRQINLENQLQQVRSIQMSLLPRRIRQLEGFDLAAATIPAEEVGGDVYDVQRVDTDTLGVMLADASGHGLPAALQARDVVVGLRMGMDKDEKITATIQRLNRVIHKSGLSSRFVSLFYGECEKTGDIFYVNCGHCPPLLFDTEGKVTELPSSGPVLGPLPNARFRRSYARLRPGEFLVIYSDGITERKAAGEENDDEAAEFGLDGLIEVCRQQLGRSSRQIVNVILETTQQFGGDAPWEDDVTVMVVRRRLKHKNDNR